MNHRNRLFEKQCPECGRLFMSHFGVNSNDLCSPTCGFEEPMEATMEHLGRVLRSREAWRYVELNSYLNNLDIAHQFEYPLGYYLFDLALVEHGILIEFDEPYHNGVVQQTKDLEKDAYAEDRKWMVIRIPAESNAVIPAHTIDHVIALL